MVNPDVNLTRQPDTKDPQEIRIRAQLENLLTTGWSKKAIEESTSLQITFLKSSIEHRSVRKSYENLLKALSETLKSHIVTGEENLDKIKNPNHIIIVTNHFGSAKLTRISTISLGIDSSMEDIEPFPIRPAPFEIIAQKLDSQIFECAVELPKPFLSIQGASGVITLPTSGENRTQQLVEKVKSVNQNFPKSIVVMYPEGGTSGKRNEGTPYDLDNFHSGTLVVAAELGLPILPVTQKLNPESGMELRISEPIFVKRKELVNKDKILEDLKATMQKSLKD